MSLVVPAVLPASQNDLEEKLTLLARIPTVSRMQIDVVDGKFAMPASWPYSAPAELQRQVERGEMLPHLDRVAYEIDLMCLDAEQAVEAWLALGATRLTFHAESVTSLPRLLASVRKQYGNVMTVGLALNIASDVSLIEPCLGEIGYVQFMGIARIGRQGQPFDRRVLEQVRVFHKRHPEVPMQVDGGVSLESAKELVALDVTNLVIGSAILRAKDPYAEVAAFEALKTSFGV